MSANVVRENSRIFSIERLRVWAASPRMGWPVAGGTVRDRRRMREQNSLAELVRRIRAGDDAAAGPMFDRFARRLIGLARKQIRPQLRTKVDPEDVVQSVYRTFFRRLKAGRIQLGDWGNVWSLLTVITMRKCAKTNEHYRAARRSAPIEMSPHRPSGAGGNCLAEVDRSPTPEEAAILAETVEQVLRGFDADDRQVIELSLQGYTVEEIGVQLSRAQRTIRRLRERVKKRLGDMLAEDASEPA